MSDRRAQLVRSLLDAYRAGAFPMADPDTGGVTFYTADPRALLPLDDAEGFRVPRTVRRTARRAARDGRRFRVTSDTDPIGVVRGCAVPRPGDGPDSTWISNELIALYRALAGAGALHSVEVWAGPDDDPALAGGIYGVSLGAAFVAESMFHDPRPRLASGDRDPHDGSGASSVALVALARHLHALGYRLLDIQMVTAHTARFGAREVPADTFMPAFHAATDGPDRWRPVEPGPADAFV